MTAQPVTLRVVPQYEDGATRELLPGTAVLIGRLIRGEPARPERVGVPGRWMGVGRHILVPVELLTVTYETWDGDAACVAWRAGAEVDPSEIRISGPMETPETSGILRISDAEPTRFVVARFNPQTERFVDRITAEVRLGGATSRVGDWDDLVVAWWRPRMDPRIPGMITWQSCLALTFRLAGDAPQGKLSRIVAQGLVRRGHPHASSTLVASAWLRSIKLLCRVLSEPGRQWMVDVLQLPWVDSYLRELRSGVPDPWVGGGEEAIRELRVALRRTGRPEWA